MTVQRVVRNCAAPSEREFSSGFTGSFVLAYVLPDSIAVWNKIRTLSGSLWGDAGYGHHISRHLEAEEIANVQPSNSLSFYLGHFILREIPRLF
jgi:hypothetical protein